MEVIIDFLLEYYIWILVVLVILLITVIGFLADTKKKRKLREKSQQENLMNNNLNNGYQGFNNMNGIDMNMMPSQGVNNFGQDMNMMLSHNIDISNNTDAFFVPASEQTPKFEPKEIVVPTPINSVPIMNSNSSNNTPIAPVEVVESPIVSPINVGPVEVPVMNGNTIPSNVNGLNTRSMVNETTVQTPITPIVNVVPEVAPVVNPNTMIMPETSMNNIINQMPVENLNMQNTTMPTANNMSANPEVMNGQPFVPQANNTVFGGVTFVTGASNNNPNNQIQNDNWQL